MSNTAIVLWCLGVVGAVVAIGWCNCIDMRKEDKKNAEDDSVYW